MLPTASAMSMLSGGSTNSRRLDPDQEKRDGTVAKPERYTNKSVRNLMMEAYYLHGEEAKPPARALPAGHWLYPEGKPGSPGTPAKPSTARLQYLDINKDAEAEPHSLHGVKVDAATEKEVRAFLKRAAKKAAEAASFAKPASHPGRAEARARMERTLNAFFRRTAQKFYQIVIGHAPAEKVQKDDKKTGKPPIRRG
jgi:hypothetical protein